MIGDPKELEMNKEQPGDWDELFIPPKLLSGSLELCLCKHRLSLTMDPPKHLNKRSFNETSHVRDVDRIY
jgi:hypothetical protein